MKSETSNVLGHLTEVNGEYFVAQLTSDLQGMSSDKMIGMDKVRFFFFHRSGRIISNDQAIGNQDS